MLFSFAAAIFPFWYRCRACIALLLIAASFSLARAANDVIDLQPAADVGRCRQAKVVIETEGKLKLNADGQEVKHLPLKASGELNYIERVLSRDQKWSEVR